MAKLSSVSTIPFRVFEKSIVSRNIIQFVSEKISDILNLLIVNSHGDFKKEGIDGTKVKPSSSNLTK